MAIDPLRGVTAHGELPQISSVSSGAACGGALIIAATRAGPPRWQAIALSVAGEVSWRHDLPVRGELERLPVIACARDRATVAWTERDRGSHALALLTLGEGPLDRVRRILLPDPSDDLMLAGGSRGLAALRTSGGQRRLEGLLIDAAPELIRRPLLTGHVFAPFLSPLGEGWLMSCTSADAVGSRVQLRALDRDLGPERDPAPHRRP